MNLEYTTVVLWCQHTLEFESDHAPALGEWVYCKRCDAMRTVEDAPPRYKIRCRRCTHSKRLGTDRGEAEHAAARHRKRNPTHKVGVYNGRKLIYTLGAQDDSSQLALQFPLEDPREPPF